MSESVTDPATEPTLHLYRYRCDCGRMGTLHGLFVVDAFGERCLRALIARKVTLYFGEVLGKHSEISGHLEEKELKRIDLDSASILKLCQGVWNPVVEDRPFKLSGAMTISGHSPMQAAMNGAEIWGLEEPEERARFLAFCSGEDPDDQEDDGEVEPADDDGNRD